MSQILLIEDNPDIMCVNAGALRIRRHDVLQAFSLTEASELRSANTPDMIVMETILPDGNGLDYCRMVKAKEKIPILFLSRYGESADIVAGFEAGGDDYMKKPYDLDVLISRIEARLRTSGDESRRSEK